MTAGPRSFPRQQCSVVSSVPGSNRLSSIVCVISSSHRQFPRHRPIRPVPGNRRHRSDPGEVRWWAASFLWLEAMWRDSSPQLGMALGNMAVHSRTFPWSQSKLYIYCFLTKLVPYIFNVRSWESNEVLFLSWLYFFLIYCPFLALTWEVESTGTRSVCRSWWLTLSLEGFPINSGLKKMKDKLQRWSSWGWASKDGASEVE